MGKYFSVFAIISGFILFTLFSYSFAQQQESCCDEAEIEAAQKQFYEDFKKAKDTKVQLEKDIDVLNKDILSLKETLLNKDNELANLEKEYAGIIASLNLSEYDGKFLETEGKINKRLGTPRDARKSYFDEISLSAAKCLPKYSERYVLMKANLEKWEIDEAKKIIVTDEKVTQYTVVKGDCLWKIASKPEIYGNSKLWVKIWEANKNGVIKAPRHTSKTIKNPDLIYPGQVLRIPSLTEAEKKLFKSKTDDIKKTRTKK